MTIQLQTAEEATAATAEIVKLEAVAQATHSALNEFETTQSSLPQQYRGDSTELKSTLTAARRALDIAPTNQHNANVYQSVLADIQANTARNAAEYRRNRRNRQTRLKRRSKYVRSPPTLRRVGRCLALSVNGQRCAPNLCANGRWLYLARRRQT